MICFQEIDNAYLKTLADPVCVKEFFVCLFICLFVFRQQSLNVINRAFFSSGNQGPSQDFSIQLAALCALFFHLLSKYVSLLMNHSSLLWKLTFGCQKGKVHCCRKNYFKETSRVKLIKIKEIYVFNFISFLQIISFLVLYFSVLSSAVFQLRTCVACVQVPSPQAYQCLVTK